MDKDLSIFIISLLDKSKDSGSILSWMELFLCSIALLFCGFFLFLVALPTKGKDIVFRFILEYTKGKDIVFRFILEYISLRDSGP
jgi:hypothetical protein